MTHVYPTIESNIKKQFIILKKFDITMPSSTYKVCAHTLFSLQSISKRESFRLFSYGEEVLEIRECYNDEF